MYFMRRLRSPEPKATEIATAPPPVQCCQKGCAIFVYFHAASSVTKFVMNLVVTRAAEAHEIAPRMGTALRYWYDMMHLIHGSEDALLEALLAEWMRLHIAVTDAFPRSAVLLFAVRITAVLFVLSRHQLCMLLAVSAVRQLSASRIRTGVFWFPWHFLHLTFRA